MRSCQSLANLLIDDIQDAVSALRGEDSVDVGRALAVLTDGITYPRIHLDVPPDLYLTDPERAHAIVRCVQEALTNAVRHSRAENFWIQLSTVNGAMLVHVRDDGVGATTIKWGSGLRGMAERLQSLGGHLQLSSQPGEGFQLDLLLPLRANAPRLIPAASARSAS
jgi:signal transduction histidine kinase